MKNFFILFLLGMSSIMFATNGVPVIGDPLKPITESPKKVKAIEGPCDCVDADYQTAIGICEGTSGSNIVITSSNSSGGTASWTVGLVTVLITWTIEACSPPADCCRKMVISDNTQALQPRCSQLLGCNP